MMVLDDLGVQQNPHYGEAAKGTVTNAMVVFAIRQKLLVEDTKLDNTTQLYKVGLKSLFKVNPESPLPLPA